MRGSPTAADDNSLHPLSRPHTDGDRLLFVARFAVKTHAINEGKGEHSALIINVYLDFLPSLVSESLYLMLVAVAIDHYSLGSQTARNV
jgi:hypothetical protein